MRPSESFINQPIRALQTMLRVISQVNEDIPGVIPDGIYGQQTIGAVNDFQRHFGLPITGITDQRTWERVVTVYEAALVEVAMAEPIQVHIDPGQVFQLGDEGPYIYLLQSMLTQLALDSPQIQKPDLSGILDQSTSEALKAFQGLSDLPVTGTLDKTTWKHLTKQFSLSAHHHAVFSMDNS